MEKAVIYNNEYISINVHPDGVYMETFKRGFSLEKLNEILTSHPEVEITNFNVLRNSINLAPKPPEKIGRIKERIIIEIAENGLKALIVFNLSKEELDMKNRENLIRETAAKLKEMNIVSGINRELFSGKIETGKPYIIAQGIPPTNGNDCIIKMYELAESKPEVHEDGKVNFYELKLINRVKSGDWLGERTDATPGVPGKSVKGEVITPVNGRNFPLNYDKNSIMEIYLGGKTVLYSRIDGAVNYKDGKITVSNFIELDGDVNFSTGNINFDGYVKVKGTVADGFSIVATKDIEINSDIGLGNVKGITSTEGSIFIKGGISSKGQVEIKAAKNIYTKFVDNAAIKCGGIVHIGFYCINSTVNASEVVMDSIKGQIIGGHIQAEIKVTAPVIGSEIEKKTIVEVTGFDRDALKNELERIFNRVGDIKNEQQKIKQRLSYLESLEQKDPYQQKEYNDCIEMMFSARNEIKDLEEGRKNITNYLKAHGDGEISITKKVFPNSVLILKKNIIEINTVTLATSYYLQDQQIKQIN